MERLDIGYRFYNRIRNTGDAILPYILEELTGFKPALANYDVPHILGCGSILFMATNASFVWGTGILNPQTHIPTISAARIFALRGKKSFELLRSLGFPLNDIPLGDPGIFAADVLNATQFTPRRRYRAAFVPHHSAVTDPFYTRLQDSDEFAFVNVLDDSLEPLRLIAESEVVISQSLHGLIFAESLNKPATWISQQFNAGWKFKFEDWLSTTANPQREPLPLSTGIDELCRRAEIQQSRIDKVALRRALPIESVIHDFARPVDFRLCRSIQPISISVPGIFSGQTFPSLAEACKAAPAVTGITDYPNRLFGRFAERVYVCLQPVDENIPVTQFQLRAMCAFLDRTLEPDVCYILPRSRLPANGVALREIGGGVAIIETPSIVGGAILLRPDVGGLTERSMAFAV